MISVIVFYRNPMIPRKVAISPQYFNPSPLLLSIFIIGRLFKMPLHPHVPSTNCIVQKSVSKFSKLIFFLSPYNFFNIIHEIFSTLPRLFSLFFSKFIAIFFKKSSILLKCVCTFCRVNYRFFHTCVRGLPSFHIIFLGFHSVSLLNLGFDWFSSQRSGGPGPPRRDPSTPKIS